MTSAATFKVRSSGCEIVALGTHTRATYTRRAREIKPRPTGSKNGIAVRNGNRRTRSSTDDLRIRCCPVTHPSPWLGQRRSVGDVGHALDRSMRSGRIVLSIRRRIVFRTRSMSSAARARFT